MSVIPCGLVVIPDKLEEVRSSDFPLCCPDHTTFGVQVVVERKRCAIGSTDPNMTSRVTVTLSLEDAKRLWNALPAAVDWAEKKNKQSDLKVGQGT